MATSTPAAADVAGTKTSFEFLNVTSNYAPKGQTAQEQNQRFLTLLTTQLKNQDPLNPMDNAQMTSQIAQISTVGGIEQLNQAIQSLTSQFGQLRAMQGASLVGRDVAVAGDRLGVDAAAGIATGRFELQAPASAVQVDVLSGGGAVLKTLQLGAQSTGQHTFDTSAAGLDPSRSYRFRVAATNGGLTVTSRTFQTDRVTGVRDERDGLKLELASGTTVPYADVKAVSGGG